MKTIQFSGHSDDIVQVSTGEDVEEHYGDNDGDVFASFVVGGRVRVRAIYDGVWSFSVGQVKEGLEFPAWETRISQAHEYSVLLAIDVPDECATVIQEKQS